MLSGTGISTEVLRLAVARTKVAALVTGAVQPKISMGKLKALELEIPCDGDLAALEREVQALTALHRSYVEEDAALARTRDELLPLLMSGKVRVRDAEQVVEGVL